MKKLIYKLFLLLLPLAIFLISMELYCRTKSTFGIKKDYLETNLNSIELLIFGSSHTQNAINPELLSNRACNLAFAGQPISIEYLLLKKYIDTLPKLKTVIFEISPHMFYRELDPLDWNGHIYSILYHINYKTEPFSLKNHSLVYSNYKFFSTFFYDYINPYSYKYKVNKYGCITNDSNDRFEKLNFDSVEIFNTFKMKHEFSNLGNFKLNILKLEKSIILCKTRGIKVVLITTPFYSTYFNQIPNNAIKDVNAFIKNMQLNYGIEYLNYSQDNRFNIYDFKDDNHLNSGGTIKFSRIVNEVIL